MYQWNRRYRSYSRGGMARFREDGTVEYRSPSLKYRLFRFSSLFRYISVNMLDYNYMAMTDAEFSTSTEQSKVSLKKLINDFNTLASKNGIGFTLVIMPFPGPSMLTSVDEQLTGFSVDPSIRVIDLFQYFSQDSIINNIDSYYWPKDGHFTAEGYKSFANGICTQLYLNWSEIDKTELTLYVTFITCQFKNPSISKSG